ncbi:MAG: DUF5666 domain-containing protein [Rhodocyclaceae bacterium]|nr:DUF5666 domain-containing protein [Rhodocyclaceae bacterium]
MLETRRIARLLLALVGLVLVLVVDAAEAANVCQGKTWVAAPVLVLGGSSGMGGTGRSGDESGMGGTGRGGDESGMGGTGRGDEGIGGTGRSGEGMGGTGAVAQAPGVAGDEGMGGTGHVAANPGPLARDEQGMGGTGIVGVIAGFGSICVNGLELHYDAATPTRMDGSSARADRLALGQVVSVRASLSGGEFRAREISVLNTVSGRVDQVAAGTARILGQTLRLPGDAAVRAGEWLAVSGSRLADGSILPTRIVRQAAGARESLMGPVSTVKGRDFRIGQLEVRLSSGRPPVAGDEVLVRGRLENGVLLADSVLTHPRTTFRGPVGHLDIQGYVRQANARSLNVDGVLIALPPGHALPNVGRHGPARDSRVEVSARVEADGRIVAERLVLERPATDVGALRQGLSDPAHEAGSSGNDGAPGYVSGAPESVSSVPESVSSAQESVSGSQGAGYVTEQSDAVRVTKSEDGAGKSSIERESARSAAKESSRSGSERSETPRKETDRIEVARPEVTKPEVAKPEVAKPEVAKPEVAKPEVAKPEIARPEIAKPEITRPEIAKPEIAKPEIARPEIVKPEIAKPEIARPEIAKPEIAKPEIARPEIVKPEIARPEIVKPEIARPEIAKPEIARPEVAKPEIVRPVIVRPELPSRDR